MQTLCFSWQKKAIYALQYSAVSGCCCLKRYWFCPCVANWRFLSEQRWSADECDWEQLLSIFRIRKDKQMFLPQLLDCLARHQIRRRDSAVLKESSNTIDMWLLDNIKMSIYVKSLFVGYLDDLLHLAKCAKKSMLWNTVSHNTIPVYLGLIVVSGRACNWIDHVTFTVFSNPCSLVSATKETIAHPSVSKQEQKVTCSGGGVIAHMCPCRKRKMGLFRGSLFFTSHTYI